MSDLPKRKPNLIESYDYSAPGAYFVTVCTAGRERLFWPAVGADAQNPRVMGPGGSLSVPVRF